MEPSDLPVLRDASDSVEDLRGDHVGRAGTSSTGAAVAGVSADITNKSHPFGALSDWQSEGQSLRTPPVSNGPSESGKDGSAQPTPQSQAHASCTSVECDSEQLCQVDAAAPDDGASSTFEKNRNDAGLGHSSASPAVTSADVSQHGDELPEDAEPGESDDAPPPLALCTMKASSPHFVQTPTLLGPSSPFVSTPMREGKASVSLVPVEPSSPSASSSSSPRTTRRTQNRRRSSHTGTAAGSKPALHRPDLSVYTPQYRRPRSDASRSSVQKSDGAAPPTPNNTHSGNCSGPSPQTSGVDACAKDEAKTADVSVSAIQTGHLPSPPSAASPRTTKKASPSQKGMGTHRRGLAQSRRKRLSLKMSVKGSMKGTAAGRTAEPAFDSITPRIPVVPSETTAASIAPRTPLGGGGGSRSQRAGGNQSCRDGGNPNSLASSSRTDDLAIHAVPLSVSNRTNATTTSTSFNGLSSHTENRLGTVVGESGTFSPPVGTPAVGTSHVARPVLSTVFCRELSTSLGGVGGNTGEPNQKTTASTAAAHIGTTHSASHRLGTFPQLRPQPPPASAAYSSNASKPSSSNAPLATAIKTWRVAEFNGGGPYGESHADDDSQPPSWYSPMVTRLSPCRSPSALRFDAASATPRDGHRGSVRPTDESAAMLTVGLQSSSDNYSGRSEEARGTDSDGDKGHVSHSANSHLPSVLVGRGSVSGSGSGEGGSSLLDESCGSANTSLASATALAARTETSPQPSHNTLASSRTSVGQISPRRAAAPSEFVLHLQNQQQQRSQRASSRHARQKDGLGATHGHSPAHINTPTSTSTAAAGATVLPSLQRTSRSQSLQMTPSTGATPLVAGPARLSPPAGRNYSLSPQSPGPQTHAVSSFHQAPGEEASTSGVGTSQLNAGALTSSPQAHPQQQHQPPSSSSSLTAGRTTPLVQGCFSMAAGTGSHHSSRTGSGTGSSLIPPTGLPLTLVKATAHAHNQGNSHSDTSHAQPHALQQGPHPTTGDRSGRPPLSTPSVPRANRSPVPMPALSGAPGPRLPRHGSDMRGQVSGAVAGHDVFAQRGADSGVAVRLSGLGDTASAGGTPDAYRALFDHTDGVWTPTQGGAPSSRRVSDGQMSRPPQVGYTPAQLDNVHTMTFAAPKAPSVTVSRPSGAWYRHGQHTGLMGNTP